MSHRTARPGSLCSSSHCHANTNCQVNIALVKCRAAVSLLGSVYQHASSPWQQPKASPQARKIHCLSSCLTLCWLSCREDALSHGTQLASLLMGSLGAPPTTMAVCQRWCGQVGKRMPCTAMHCHAWLCFSNLSAPSLAYSHIGR